MLPIQLDMNKFIPAISKEADELEKKRKNDRTSRSQQIYANQAVLSSTANNPNGQPIQQPPAHN